ncbi:MAG: hypothetical protein RL194_490 [Pseudomonadota bacterium]|jgi:hypothetical protein
MRANPLYSVECKAGATTPAHTRTAVLKQQAALGGLFYLARNQTQLLNSAIGITLRLAYSAI